MTNVTFGESNFSDVDALTGSIFAACISALGIVLNLVGCLSGATMAFLLPGLFWARLKGGWTPVSAILCGIGGLVAIVGTYYSMVNAQ